MSNVGTNGRACVWITFVDPSQPCAVIVIVQLCPFSIIQAATRTLQPAKTTSALLDCRLQLCTLFRRSWRIALASLHALTDSLLLQMCRRLLACNIRHGCGLNRLGKSKTPARIAASAFRHEAKARLRFPSVARRRFTYFWRILRYGTGTVLQVFQRRNYRRNYCRNCFVRLERSSACHSDCLMVNW